MTTLSRLEDRPARLPWMDAHGRAHTYLRVSLTDRCNFRCVYCMPPEGIPWREREEILTFEEIERAVRLFVRGGVRKVRLTGGEPTVRRGLTEFIGRLSAIEGVEQLWMTTNGTTLRHHAAAYRKAGLTGLNVSLDSLRRDRFIELTRRDGLETVLEGIEAALAAGFAPLKLNVVVMAGVNEDELQDFVRFVADRPIQARFIEFMPFQGNGWSKGGLYPMAKMLEDLAPLEVRPVGQEPTAVGKDYEALGGRSKLAFVASMTRSFCSGCNRIRLTADGQVKSCLFLKADGNLRDAMRNGAGDEELAAVVRHSLAGKWAAHPPMEDLLTRNDLSMVEIGG